MVCWVKTHFLKVPKHWFYQYISTAPTNMPLMHWINTLKCIKHIKTSLTNILRKVHMRLWAVVGPHTAPSPVHCEIKGVCTTVTSTFPGLWMKPSPERAPALLPEHRAELNITTSPSVHLSFFGPFSLQVAPRFGGQIGGPGASTGCWLCAPPGSSPLLCAALSYSDPGERNTCKNWKMSWQSQRNLANELLSLVFFILTQPVSQFCSFGVCVVYHLWPGL